MIIAGQFKLSLHYSLHCVQYPLVSPGTITASTAALVTAAVVTDGAVTWGKEVFT